MAKAPALMSATARKRFRAALENADLEELNRVAEKYDINGPFSNEEWDGESLLDYSIRKDRPEDVRLLLLAGADAHYKFREKDRNAVSIFRAAKYAGFDVFEQIARAGVPYDANDLLGPACHRGDRQVIQYLLDHGGDPPKPEALGEAVLGCHPELVKWFIDQGADVNKLFRSLANYVPITAATESRSPRALECLILLLDAGADPNAVAHRKYRFTALYGAAGNGSPEMIERLIAAGGDPNVVVPYAGTPLTHAIEENHLDNLVALLKSGADPMLRPTEDQTPSIAGKSAVEFAKEQRRFHMLPFLKAAAAGKPIPEIPSEAQSIHKQLKIALEDESLSETRTLNPGATDSEIKDLEASLELSLPSEFKDWYKIANGQPEASDPLVIYYDMGEVYAFFRLLTLDEIERERTFMLKMLADPHSGWDDTSFIINCEPRRSLWWHEGWIPVASDLAGQYIVMDLAPTSLGIHGQIIAYNHEEGPQDVIADSLLNWLQNFSVEMLQ